MLLRSLRIGSHSGLIGLLVITVILAASTTTSAGGIKRPLKKLAVDPQAETVELFAGIESGQLAVRMIPKDEFQANVFIENKTKQPLTVKLPRTAVGVQVLKQGFGPAGAAGAGNNANLQGNYQQQGNGQAQNVGGGFGMGFGGMGMGGMGMGGVGMGMGMGMFSVPPERTAQVPFTSVCLNHGQPTPRAAMNYKLVPTEAYTQDPVLQELLVHVSTGKLERGAAQAAVWHVANKMSWGELASKSIESLGGFAPSPYFSREQLVNALSLLQTAKAQAEQKQQKNATPAKTEKKL